MGLIYNKHIRNDWTAWGVYPDDKKRVTTLCGKITSVKYAGVPGVEPEQVPAAFGDGDYAWCILCCGFFLVQVLNVMDQVSKTGSVDLARVYQNAVKVVNTQLTLVTDPTSVK